MPTILLEFLKSMAEIVNTSKRGPNETGTKIQVCRKLQNVFVHNKN